MPLSFVVTAGQRQEGPLAETLINKEISDYLIADRGYENDSFRQKLREQNIIPVIPGKKNRVVPVEYDTYIYKKRHFIERFFNRLKQFRRIATRYEKTVLMFLGALTLVRILIWLKL